MTSLANPATVPRLYNADRGEDALLAVPWASGALADLIAGTASCSPFLSSLIAKEADWLESASQDPAAAFEALMDGLPQLAASELAAGLRAAKRRVALITALADVGGVWPLEAVTQRLSRFAALAVDCGARTLVAEAIRRGQLPGLTEADADTAGGYIVLAMGKMGAGELNYSSDIDLICLFDDDRFDPGDVAEARSGFVKVTRKLAAMLSDITAEGYVFRTDLRLRPDPSVTPVCLSVSAAERYYEAEGRTWERAAFIKAAACAGDIDAGHRFLKTLIPFVWRKHLDFAAIEDAHDMRLRIRDHKGLHGTLDLYGHNMKLGRGGIREIEFFAQTRQIIAGGRDMSLRVPQTVGALQALSEAGWIDASSAAVLADHYRAHRQIEHRLQMIGDAQTHDLPSDDAGFDRLAAFVDQDPADLMADLRQRCEAVHEITEGFFAPSAQAASGETSDWGAEVIDQWARYPALRSPRATAIFKRLWPDIRDTLRDAPKPEEALAQFDRFLVGLPAGVQVFALFEANPPLTKLIVDVVATAPALAAYLSRHAGVLDAVIAGHFFDGWPGKAALAESLQAAMDAAPDYEAQLTTARRWAGEWHFRTGVHFLRGLIDAKTAAQEYADLAEAVVDVLWGCVQQDFARKHGPAPGQGAAVVAMGSLGARRLNAVSDLDLIVIYDATGVEMSDGKRPLATRTYYARLTQALITALTVSMADGRLYEVDMRLRPSGRQGPVATSLAAFEQYQQTEAWTWEHLALTRGRVIAGPAALAARIEDVRAQVLRAKSTGETIAADTADMRRRLAEAKPPQSQWDMRNGTGRLQDLELLAQLLALTSGAEAVPTDFAGQIELARGSLTDEDRAQLLAAYEEMWALHHAARLLTGAAFDPDTIGEQGRRFVLSITSQDTVAGLQARLEAQISAVGTLLDAALGAK